MTVDPEWLSKWLISRENSRVECSICTHTVEVTGPGTSSMWMEIGVVLKAIADDGHDCRRV